MMLILNNELKNRCNFEDLKNDNTFDFNIYKFYVDRNKFTHYPSSTKE